MLRITRYRKTINSEEKSILDYFIVCKRFYSMVKSMIVDEERAFALTKYSGRTGNKSIKESDHNTLIIELNINWKNFLDEPTADRIEINNFKNEKEFERFVNLSGDNKALKSLFNDEKEDIEISSHKWLKAVNQIIHSSFSKIRIKKGKINIDLEELFHRKESLKAKIAIAENDDDHVNHDLLIEELENVSEQISHICSDKNKQIVEDFIGDNDSCLEGFNQVKTWGLKKKLAPKNVIDPPAAKKDRTGKLVTDRAELENLYLETYKARLSPNQISEDLVELKNLKEFLFSIRKQLAEKEVSKDWTVADLDIVLKSLKNNKARDAHGHVYELYKYGGNDLKFSMLRMFNMIKRKQIYPKILQSSNISSFYKRKGDKSDLDNDRGVFNVVKIRSILDKLVYNDIYSKVDSSMSSSNIGARRKRNIRDHLFVINGILNDVNENKSKTGVDIGIYDIAKCFDKMWYSETGNDIFKAGVQDDKFILIANSNKECQVAIKTPWGGLTDRISFSELEMQGTVLSNIKCSVQVDSLGQDCIRENKGIFKYKNCISIPPLSMVDDVITISSCGVESVKVNAVVQAKVQCKQLELGHLKCFNMHVGKRTKELCPQLSVHGKDMLKSEKQKYLGDILTTSGRINENITERYNKGIGKVNEILGILHEVSFGPHYFQMALLFRNSILINSLLCSAEALYGITGSHIDKLEQVDRTFFRRLFQVPKCTAIEAFYLETAALPIRHILIGRRLMYLWDILHKNENELVRKVFNAQKEFSVRNDWTTQVQQDLLECEIHLTEEEISRMKRITFKNMVREKLQLIAARYLISKKLQHSKSQHLTYSKKMKAYLENESLKIDDKRLMFKIRNRLIDVKANYRGKYKDDLSCRLCKAAEESQPHLFTCEKILSDNMLRDELKGFTYTDIFSTNLKIQAHMIDIWNKILKLRSQMLNHTNNEDSSSQVSPLSGASCTDFGVRHWI